MNKQQTLAANRIKSKIARHAKSEALAVSRAKAAEAKTVKMKEAFDAAKDVIAKHKNTLELAKNQILEQRELIKNYEKLLNMKYSQNEALKRSLAALKAEAKKMAEAKGCKKEGELEVPPVKPDIAPLDKQAVKPADSEKPKAECATIEIPVKPDKVDDVVAAAEPEKADDKKPAFDEAKARKIASYYREAYGMNEAASMNVLRKYSLHEASVKLQSVANTLKKYKTESASKIKRANEAKARITAKSANESATSGTSLYSLFV